MGRGHPINDNTIIADPALEDWAAIGERAAEAARAAPWREGDWLVDRIGAGNLTVELRAEAMRVTRREATELTRLVSVCRAFPPDRRRSDLFFDHHAAVMKLVDAERDVMLARAAAEGWTARQTRRAVLDSRVATGAFFPAVDDDPDDTAYRAIAQAWNRGSRVARETFMGSAEEAGLSEIVL